MSEINQKIDFVLRQRRRKNIFLGVIILAPLILYPLWFYLPPLGEISEVSGTVLRLVGAPTYGSPDLYIIVQLDDGREVKSFIPSSLQYKKGGKVRLLKKEPLIFGGISYWYNGYIE